MVRLFVTLEDKVIWQGKQRKPQSLKHGLRLHDARSDSSYKQKKNTAQSAGVIAHMYKI